MGFGLLSSVVNGCQRSEGFAGEDWNHKVERLRRQKGKEGRKARKHRVTENTERGSRKPGRQKARKPRKHRVTENTERKIAMVGACLGVGQSGKDLQWTVSDATV